MLKNEKGENVEMRKKRALALAVLLLIVTFPFAPIAAPSWPPPIQCDTYVIMGGQKELMVAFEYGPIIMILHGYSQSREPYFKPGCLFEEICFSEEYYPGIVTINVTWGTPLVHVMYVPMMGSMYGMPWLRITEVPLPGFGWIYTVDGIADVDYYTFDNDTGHYWDTPGDPYGFNGKLATPNPNIPAFLDPGPDLLPGFLPTKDDGFGDGIPDPKGSSVLYLPEVFKIEGYNATTDTWELLMAAPLMCTMTTGVAYDHVREPTSALYCMDSLKVGEPWEFLRSCLPTTDPSWKKTVAYAAAGSVMDFVLDPGPPVRIALDILYDKQEKKVREDSVIADITCDKVCDIEDIVRCALALWAQDEGLGLDGIPNTADDKKVADARYDARADMDCNGLIDICDLVRIAADFGKTIDP